MANRNKIPVNTLRLLYAHSGNCCAFEGCYNPIFEDDGTLTGECCHIEAYSSHGARYNERLTNQEKNGYDNLILMCSRHHKIIDNHPEQYTVENLKALKKAHENQYKAQHLKATDTMLKQLQAASTQYWSFLKLLEENDDTGLKMKLGDNNINTLIKEVDELFKGLHNSIDSITESFEKLQEDIRVECEKCGIDYSLFEKIPYYENSLVNREWETVHLAFPNIMNALETRYFQLCVSLLEKLVVYDQDYLDILNRCKTELTHIHEHAYYVD